MSASMQSDRAEAGSAGTDGSAGTALFQLTYMSQSLLAGPPELVAAEVEALNTRARQCNAELGVTGALLFKGSYFSQVLEGPRANVTALMARILSDPRHRAVTVMEETAVPVRSFPNWSMTLLQPRGDFDWTLLDRMMMGYERVDRQRARSVVSMMQYCLMAQ